MCWVCLSAWLTTASSQTIKQPNPIPRLLVIGSYFSDGSDGEYMVFRTFIVNHSDDTLRFWGSNSRPTEFFTMTNNDYMHIADEEGNSSVFEQIAIPPHRSLLIPLKLVVDKQPHEIVRPKVTMKFYRWFASVNFKEDRKKHKPEILSDTMTLKYNKNGNIYYAKSDWGEHQKKQKMNLPTTKLYLLNVNERKLYTVTVDGTKISRAAKGEYSYIKEKVFKIPVTVHNNSNEPLKYYSMSCSWDEFYHIDNSIMGVLMSPCEKNIPTEVTIAPHSAHTDIIAFSCKKNSLKTLQRFRIGLNINKNVNDDPFGGYDDELDLYNIVWSNEIQFHQ